MLILLVSYISLGIISIIIGPVAGEINDLIRQIKTSTSNTKRTNQKHKVIIAKITLGVFTILFYPLLYPIIFHHLKSLRRQKQLDNVKLLDYRLFFFKISGSGVFSCNDCSFNQKIIAHLHGAKGWQLSGCQCQTCGKFHKTENYSNNLERQKCDCGGILERDNPIFCPKCRSFQVGYEMRIIT